MLEYVINHSPLSREVYWFYLDKSTLFLSGYEIQNRDTTRHKFLNIEWYDSNFPARSSIKKEDVPMNDEIKAAIIAKAASMLTVKI